MNVSRETWVRRVVTVERGGQRCEQTGCFQSILPGLQAVRWTAVWSGTDAMGEPVGFSLSGVLCAQCDNRFARWARNQGHSVLEAEDD